MRGAGVQRSAVVASLGLALVLSSSACTPAPQGDPAPLPTSTSTTTPEPEAVGPVQPVGDPEVIAEGLDLPWSLVRLESGSTLVSERDTALVKEVLASGEVREVGAVPGVVPGGEGGLLGLAVPDPSSASGTETTWLYAYTTAESDNRVIRMPLEGDAGAYSLGAPEDVLTGIPKAGNHNGGRIKFGPDGMLYVTAGDAANGENSQDRESLGGKILRLNPDGSVPSDNPFPGSPVYTWGHRNPQGITWDADGRMWAAEFGQNTWDEFNLIEAGNNYGWPIIEGIGDDPDYVNPIYQWSTSEASPSGLLWTRDTFFLAALRGERLWAIYTQGEQADAVDYFTGDYGRLRDVIEGPDDTIWVLTNNTRTSPREGDDKILQIRLAPLEEG